MLFISERRLRRLRPCHTNTESSTGALSATSRKHAGGPRAGSRSIPRSAKAVPGIVRQDFHWVKTDWAVVLLLARCGRTVLLEETALSVGSADNVTVNSWLSYGRSVSRF